MYKLVAMDLDGTLLNSEKKISDRNKEAIRRVMNKGIRVIVCSGKIFAGAKIFAREIMSKEPIIACNGAVIKDMNSGDILFSDSIRHEDSCKVIDICRSTGIYFHTYIDDTMYTEKLEFSSLYYYRKNEGLSEQDKVDIRLMENLEEVINSSSIQASKFVVISEDMEKLQKTRKLVEKIATLGVMSSEYNNFEVVNQGVNKGNALRILAQKLNVKQKEIVAIGDNENDYSMLKYAGLGIAMGNAEPYIKEIASYVTSSNDEDGIAKALYQFIP